MIHPRIIMRSLFVLCIPFLFFSPARLNSPFSFLCFPVIFLTFQVPIVNVFFSFSLSLPFLILVYIFYTFMFIVLLCSSKISFIPFQLHIFPCSIYLLHPTYYMSICFFLLGLSLSFSTIFRFRFC